MAIRWDPVLTAAVAVELQAMLAGARLRGIFLDHGAATLHGYFREATVLFDLGPSSLGVEILDASEPPEGSRPFPCKLKAVEHIPDERVLVLVLKRLRGRGGSIRIVVEFVPRRSNALVVEGEEWTVRHVLVPRSGTRAPRVGRPYEMPVSERRGTDVLVSQQEWMELLESEETPKSRRSLLLREVAFASPINATALLDTNEATGATSLKGGHELWERLRRIGLEIELGDDGFDGLVEDGLDSPAAHILQCEWGGQPYPTALPGYRDQPAESLLQAIGEVRRAEGAAAVLTPSRWTKALKEALRLARKKHGKLLRELEATPEPKTLRSHGDLILAHLGAVKKGAAEVTLPSFEGDSETIMLDPALSPQRNADRFYDRAGRAERARAALPAMIRDADSAIAELGALQERVMAGEAPENEIRSLLGEPGSAGRGNRDPSGPALPYRRYQTSGGLEVRVGRGSKANDQLTFKHSAPNDVWLHARHSAGAHVVLRWTDKDSPPARDLEEAAILAALHSRARNSGSVPVDWTRRKYVRKPRKSPPGLVQLERAKTLFVEPDPTLLDLLKPRT